MTTKKRVISIILIIIALPLSFATAAEGGGFLAHLFAILLSVGVDMLFDKGKAEVLASNNYKQPI